MELKNINIRPIQIKDTEQLELWRREYLDAWLELPHGLQMKGVETAVAEKQGRMIGSLTATSAVVMDPFIHDKNATGPEIFSAVLALERVLSYKAQSGGAVDSYIAIPAKSEEYIKMVEKCGYVRTLQDCVVLRRPLIPDTVPLLEDEESAAYPV